MHAHALCQFMKGKGKKERHFTIRFNFCDTPVDGRMDEARRFALRMRRRECASWLLQQREHKKSERTDHTHMKLVGEREREREREREKLDSEIE